MRPLFRTTATVLSVASCMLLSSCWKTVKLFDGTRVDVSEEVANVYVSAYPAVPWSSISEKLEPKHNLSTADARALAAVTTQSQVSQVLSTFAAGLAIGLPGRTSATTSLLNADGTTTTTGSKKLEPGSVPSSSGATPIALTDSNLAADLTKNPFANGIDAATQLMVGSGVYQLAQILDNQISKALPLKGYQAHLVTFQVNLQPLRRDLPYDAYVNVTLLPASWTRARSATTEVEKSANELSPVIVYPLIVADAMESSSVGRSVENIKQAAFALSGVVQNIGVSGGLNKGLDELDSRLGSDRNTLVTVGRISDHTLRIRIGAQQQGSQKLALVPRTQNVSVVVFTRAGVEQSNYIDRLSVITETTFVDAQNGEVLESKYAKVTRSSEDINAVIALYGFELSKTCSNDKNRSGDFLRAVDRSDFNYVSRCIQETVADATTKSLRRSARVAAEAKDQSESGPQTLSQLSHIKSSDSAVVPNESDSLTPLAESRLRRVLAKVMTLLSDSRFSKLMVVLKPYREIKPESPKEEQVVFLSDDNISSKIVLRGGRDLDADDISAHLKILQNGENADLLPISVEVDATGTTTTLVFPSLSATKLLVPPAPLPTVGKSNAAASGSTPPTVTLEWKIAKKPMPRAPASSAAEADTEAKADAAAKAAEAARSAPTNAQVASANASQKNGEADQATNTRSYKIRILAADALATSSPVSVSSTVLVADANGTAKLTVVVGVWDAKAKGVLGLRVTGAEVRASEPASAFDATRNALTLSPSSVVTLTLGNVSSAQVVQLRTIADKNPVGNPITLPVEPLRVSSK